MTEAPIHPQSGFFAQTVAATGIDYHHIVARPCWSFREADERARRTMADVASGNATRRRAATPISARRRERRGTVDGSGADAVVTFLFGQGPPIHGSVDS